MDINSGSEIVPNVQREGKILRRGGETWNGVGGFLQAQWFTERNQIIQTAGETKE